MDKYLNTTFESSAYETPQFAQFAKNFKAEVKTQLEANGLRLYSWSKGHFYCAGFAEKDGKFVFFSIPDVRYFVNGWYDDILIRTAKSPKDYRGGANNSTTLEQFGVNVAKLIQKEHVQV